MSDVTEGCLIVCGACFTPLPDEEHGEACACLLRAEYADFCGPLSRLTTLEAAGEEIIDWMEER